jgi:hypothetical protein
MTDGTADWGSHGDDYVVPAGQTCTRFAFRTVSTGSGSPSVGNFLDAVAFTVTIPAGPDPTTQITPPPTDGPATATPTDRGTPLAGIALVVLAALTGLGSVLARKRTPIAEE